MALIPPFKTGTNHKDTKTRRNHKEIQFFFVLSSCLRVFVPSWFKGFVVPIVAIAQRSSHSEAANRGGVHFGACYTSVSGSGNRAETALRILFAASEVVGFAKTGGLADVA